MTDKQLIKIAKQLVKDSNPTNRFTRTYGSS